MKPKHIARARKFIGKRWYWRMRILKQRKMYSVWDRMLIACENKDVPICCQELEKYLRKEEYYKEKLK